jgi:hypothetical protein
MLRPALAVRDAVAPQQLLKLGGSTPRRVLPALIGRIERLADGKPLVGRRGGVMRTGPAHSEQRVRERVLELHGLVGASSLARSVDGVSRRRAGLIKQEVLEAHERDRKHRCARIEVTSPGIVRGFDAMHLPQGFALIAADACVPYRTSAKLAAAYDAEHVAALLEEDFHRHGAPLVLRADRATCHTAAPVMSVLRRHRVLLLQGPAYYAPYYGQHERQNREHRGWWGWLGGDARYTQAELDQMKSAFNERWLRPTLGWRTAADCWMERGTVDEYRDELQQDILHRTERLRARGVTLELAPRLAIEQALKQKGYLRITPGRGSLCELAS